MRTSIFLVSALALSGALVSRASAQQTITHDTLSESAPVGLSCGFCASEAYGVIFREIGGISGLQPTAFPLEVQSVSLALGAAEVTGSPAQCHGLAAGGQALVHLEVWAGTMLVDAADIHAMPAIGTAWPGEELVASFDDLPVQMSVPTTDGGTGFNLMLNEIPLAVDPDPFPAVDETHRYLRVVVQLQDGGSSSTCTPATDAPAGFPVRDDDGTVMDHRSFIFASGGVGWLWNDAAGVHGDWGLRVKVRSLPRPDAGVDAAGLDAGSTSDAGSRPDAATIDGGTTTPAPASSCGCAASAPRTGWLATSTGLACLGVALARRRGRRREAPSR